MAVESSDYERPSIWFINFDTNSLKIFRRDMIQVVRANRVIYEYTNATSVSIAIKTNYIIIWNTYEIVRNGSIQSRFINFLEYQISKLRVKYEPRLYALVN